MIEPIAVTVVTPPASEPVTLEEAKDHARVRHDHDDAYLSSLIAAATAWVENDTARAFVPQTLRLTLQGFPRERSFDLPRSPVTSSSSEVSVSYRVAGSTSYTAFASSNYIIDHEHEPARIALKRDLHWPTAELESRNAVRVDFVAGYSDIGSVPEIAKLCIKQLTAEMYRNREPTVTGTVVSKLPFALTALLDKLRVVTFA